MQRIDFYQGSATNREHPSQAVQEPQVTPAECPPRQEPWLLSNQADPPALQGQFRLHQQWQIHFLERYHSTLPNRPHAENLGSDAVPYQQKPVLPLQEWGREQQVA